MLDGVAKRSGSVKRLGWLLAAPQSAPLPPHGSVIVAEPPLSPLPMRQGLGKQRKRAWKYQLGLEAASRVPRATSACRSRGGGRWTGLRFRCCASRIGSCGGCLR